MSSFADADRCAGAGGPAGSTQDKAAQDATGGGGGRSVMLRRDSVVAYQASLQTLEEVLARHLCPLGARIELVTSRAVMRGDKGEQGLAYGFLATQTGALWDRLAAISTP